mmetsp:Transcript_19708/g.17419  ORF Transcript_19708/g.17419 Transcript_19708/m.17419 type:complete len:275 (-) Transcript_19708:155-979(-)
MAQKRFGYKMANPKELKKTHLKSIRPKLKSSMNLSRTGRRVNFMRALTKNFGFSFEDEEKEKQSETIVENIYKPEEYLKMTSLNRFNSIGETLSQPKKQLNIVQESIIYSENINSSQEETTTKNNYSEMKDTDSLMLSKENIHRKEDSKFKNKLENSLEKGLNPVDSSSQLVNEKANIRILSMESMKINSPSKFKKKRPYELEDSSMQDCVNMIYKQINTKERIRKNFKSASPIFRKNLENASYTSSTCASKLRNIKQKIVAKLPNIHTLKLED